MPDEPRLRPIGWGPFRLPGEARRWADAEARARNTHALAAAPASRLPASPPGGGPAPAAASTAVASAPATSTTPSATAVTSATSATAADSEAQPASAAVPPAEAAPRRVMEPLTPEERTMVELLAEGHNVSHIAKELSISTRRVTSALVTINRKTGRFDQAGFAELVAHLRFAESRSTPDPD